MTIFQSLFHRIGAAGLAALDSSGLLLPPMDVEAAIVIYERLGIRCIFASAHADAATRKLAERAHPLGWLDKPYTGGQLVATVRECLGSLTSLAPEATLSSPSSHSIH